MATVQRYVNTASSGGDGTTNNTSGSTAAYASLSSWEANSGGSATDDYIVDCSGTAADTTNVTIDFPTNLTTGTATVRGHASSGTGKYNGSLLISTSHYRLSPTGSVSSLLIAENNVTVDGIQVECQGGSFRAAINFASSGNAPCTIRNNHARASGTCAVGIGSGGTKVGTNSTLTIENNVVGGFDSALIEVQPDNFRTPTVNIRHNTLYGDWSCRGVQVVDAVSGGGNYTIKANGIGNTDSDGDDDLLRLPGADRSNGGEHRRSSGNAVVNDHDNPT